MLPPFEHIFEARRPQAFACRVICDGLRPSRLLGAATERTAKMVEGVPEAEALACISRALEAAKVCGTSCDDPCQDLPRRVEGLHAAPCSWRGRRVHFWVPPCRVSNVCPARLLRAARRIECGLPLPRTLGVVPLSPPIRSTTPPERRGYPTTWRARNRSRTLEFGLCPSGFRPKGGYAPGRSAGVGIGGSAC